MGLPQNILETW